MSSGFPVFSTVIAANNVVQEKDFMASQSVTDEEKKYFSNVMAKTGDPERIVLMLISGVFIHFQFGSDSDLGSSDFQSRFLGTLQTYLNFDTSDFKLFV